MCRVEEGVWVQEEEFTLARYLQGEIAVMSTSFQRTHKTESRAHLDISGVGQSSRRRKYEL